MIDFKKLSLEQIDNVVVNTMLDGETMVKGFNCPRELAPESIRLAQATARRIAIRMKSVALKYHRGNDWADDETFGKQLPALVLQRLADGQHIDALIYLAMAISMGVDASSTAKKTLDEHALLVNGLEQAMSYSESTLPPDVHNEVFRSIYVDDELTALVSGALKGGEKDVE